MDSFAEFLPEQRLLLESKIEREIENYPLCTCSTGIVLFDRDVSSLILSVLTDSQYSKYIKREHDAAWLLHRAADRLNIYYIIERKIPIEKEDEILDTEVFGPK